MRNSKTLHQNILNRDRINKKYNDSSTLSRVATARKNKKPREREREREENNFFFFFLVGKMCIEWEIE